MLIPVGPLVNALAVLVGACVGLLFGSRLPERIRLIVFQALGLCTMVIGMQMAFKTTNPLIMIFSVLLGSVLGSFLRLEERLGALSDWLKLRCHSKNPQFTAGMVTATVLFCVGSMAILGSFDEGLQGSRTIVYTKSILDCFAAIALAAAYGIGVLFAAVPLLLYQGSLTLLAGSLQPLLTTAVIQELSAAGGVLIIGIGINLLEIKRIPLCDMLPALLIAVLLASF